MKKFWIALALGALAGGVVYFSSRLALDPQSATSRGAALSIWAIASATRRIA